MVSELRYQKTWCIRSYTSPINPSEIGSNSSQLTTFIYDQKAVRNGFANMVASMNLQMTFAEDPKFVNFIQFTIIKLINN